MFGLELNKYEYILTTGCGSETSFLTRWTRDYYATALLLKRDYFMTS